MIKVKESLKLNPKILKSGPYGIEVEVEGENLPRNVPGWNTVEDGSLRGESAEYIFPNPRSIPDTKKSLLNLKKSLSKSKLNSSVRTAVHVHMNVQDIPTIKMANIVTTYYILEELLTYYSGAGRDGNAFCLRVCDADFVLERVCRAFEHRDLSLLSTDSIRYSSLNLNALSKFGSLEFRSLRTPDSGQLSVSTYRWVLILNSIKNFSMRFDDPLSVMKFFDSKEPLDFVRSVLGRFTKRVISVEDVLDRIDSGSTNARDLAFCTNWDFYKVEKLFNPFPTLGG